MTDPQNLKKNPLIAISLAVLAGIALPVAVHAASICSPTNYAAGCVAGNPAPTVQPASSARVATAPQIAPAPAVAPISTTAQLSTTQLAITAPLTPVAAVPAPAAEVSVPVEATYLRPRLGRF